MISKKFYIRGALLTAFIMMMATAIFTVNGKSVSTKAQSRTSDDSELKRVIRQEGLRGAARIKGNYVVTSKSHWFAMFDLESLTKHSAIAIIGTPLHNASKLNADGDDITTDYQVAVSDTIKGKLNGSETITVSLPGGRVEFEDGTSAEIRIPDFKKMVNGKTYALFLVETESGSGIYIPVGGAQGIFEVSADDMKIKPYGEPIDKVTKENKDKDVASFIKEARKAAKKWPEPGSCCQ